MIILPAIGAIVAAVAPIVEAALVAAGIGAVLGGAACGIGNAVSGYQEQGSLNREIAVSAAHRAGECAVEGAVVGGATGAVGLVVAPVVAPAVGAALTAVDDVVRPAIQVADDIARPAIQAADDAIGPTLRRFGNTITAPTRMLRSQMNARNYVNLSRGTGNRGYVYVMDDVSNPGRYKIGKTTRPANRLSEVQSKTGLKLDYSCIIGTDDMKSLEGALFEEFERQRRRNLVPGTTEMFILNAAQVAAACSY